MTIDAQPRTAEGSIMAEEEHQDPFLLHTELRAAGQTAELSKKWEGGEHQWLGSQGARLLAAGDEKKLKMLRELQRPNDEAVLSYGEVVALSGDFYGSPEELFLEKPARIPWWKGTNDLATLRKALKNELDWIERDQRHTAAGYPDNTLTFLWTAKSYVELAEDNTDHFGWHNVKRYCQCHAQAVEYAMRADKQNDSDPLWMRALFYNGFSDHFLTDGFAAGHIRVPRQQIRDWAATQGYSGKLAGFLSKLLHDQDGHTSSWHAQGEKPLDVAEGLPVENAVGQKWRARCDGQLFLAGTDQSDPLIGQPVAAVAASLRELFQARETKQAPDGTYAALEYVPFPSPGSQSLADKFSNTSSKNIAELLKRCQWFTKLTALKIVTDASLDAHNITALFQALPELMRRFRESVEADCASTPELKARLPASYIEAFRTIG
jgi:hypothetical protein